MKKNIIQLQVDLTELFEEQLMEITGIISLLSNF